PAYMWRAVKSWRGLRGEVPWVNRSPAEIVRDNVRLTTQPFDVPESRDEVNRLIEQLGSEDVLLFSSDYPHWQFDGDGAISPALSKDLVRKITWDNPLKTYPRLMEAVQ